MTDAPEIPPQEPYPPEFEEEPPYPPEIVAEIRDSYSPASVFREKAVHDLLAEPGLLPENIFARGLAPKRLAELLALAVDRAREAFLAGEDRGRYLLGLRPGFSRQRWEIFEEEWPKTRAFLADPDARKAALPIFEEEAEWFVALTRLLVRIVHEAPPVEGTRPVKAHPGLHGLADQGMPWEQFDGRPFAITVISLAATAGGARRVIRGPLKAAGLPDEEIDAAAKRIQAELLAMVNDFPYGRPFPSVMWKTDVVVDQGGAARTFSHVVYGPEAPIGNVWAYLGTADESAVPGTPDSSLPPAERDPGYRQLRRGTFVLIRVLSVLLERALPNLIAKEAAAAGERRGRLGVPIPSELSIPVLFNAGGSLRNRLDLLRVIENVDDGDLSAVTYSIFTKEGEETGQLRLNFDPLSAPIRRRALAPETWRAEALALLSERLGPERLLLYYALWDRVDSDGDFAFHPAPFLEMFGMVDDTRARARWTAHLEALTRVQFKVNRKYGPGAGFREVHYDGPLIEKSQTKLTLVFPGRSRLRCTYYHHAPLMREIQRKFHVRVPREAFALVGEWRPGAGVKEDGLRAFALVATAYVHARAYAGREGRQGEKRYRGAAGFEIPLEEILTTAGFASPERIREHRGEETERAAEVVERLTREFRLFGPGTTVRNGRFVFDPPPALRVDLKKIAAAAGEPRLPETPPETIDVPPKRRRRRGTAGGGRGGKRETN